MAEPRTFPIGQAPWEAPQPKTFPVGQAPWEQQAAPQAKGSGNEFLDAHPNLKTAVSGAIEDLPMAGGIVGGAAGLASPIPGGAILGAGTGAAAGVQFRDKLNDWIFGKKTSQLETETNMAKEGLINAGAQGIGEAIPAVGKALASTKVGSALIEGAGNLAAKVSGKIFEVAPEVIKKYATAAKEIAKLSSAADGDIAAASDEVKRGFAKSLDGFRQDMNQQIGQALQESKETVQAAPIIDALQQFKKSINKILNPEQVSQVDNMILKTKKLAGMAEEAAPKDNAGELAQFLGKMTGKAGEATKRGAATGEIPVAEAHQLKQYFQDLATTAYRNPGESSVGTAAAKAAQRGAAVARKLVNAKVPEVAGANNQLQLLHSVEDSMNKSLIKEGAADSGLVAAGRGAEGNARNARALERLGEITGQDFLGEAQKLAAMKDLTGPRALSLKKAGVGAAVGGGAGYLADGREGAIVGGTLGAGITSPFALKKGIDLGLSGIQSLSTPLGQQALGQSVMRGSGAVNAIRRNNP